MKNSNKKLQPSSGNVFKDLGLENPEELKIKSGLVYRIASLIKERKLTASKSIDNKQKDEVKPSVENKESNNVEISVRPLNPILSTVPDTDDMIQQSTPSVGLIASSSSADYLDYGRDADLNPSSTTADVELKADDVLDLLVTSF